MRVSNVQTNYKTQNLSKTQNPNFTAKLVGAEGVDVKALLNEVKDSGAVIGALKAIKDFDFVDRFIITISKSRLTPPTYKLVNGDTGKVVSSNCSITTLLFQIPERLSSLRNELRQDKTVATRLIEEVVVK